MSEPGKRQVEFLFVLLVFLATACASSNVLSLNYQLPPQTGAQLNRSVSIGFADERKNDDFLTRDARNELEGFSGAYALTVSNTGGTADLKGAYTLDGLFKEVLRNRLQAAGIKVTPSAAPADAELKLILKEFQLDFGDRKWTAVIAYEAQLLRNGTALSRQTVNGSAERFMVMKKTDAEKVTGELVSDAINKLDVALLLKQAGL